MKKTFIIIGFFLNDPLYNLTFRIYLAKPFLAEAIAQHYVFTFFHYALHMSLMFFQEFVYGRPKVFYSANNTTGTQLLRKKYNDRKKIKNHFKTILSLRACLVS